MAKILDRKTLYTMGRIMEQEKPFAEKAEEAVLYLATTNNSACHNLAHNILCAIPKTSKLGLSLRKKLMLPETRASYSVQELATKQFFTSEIAVKRRQEAKKGFQSIIPELKKGFADEMATLRENNNTALNKIREFITPNTNIQGVLEPAMAGIAILGLVAGTTMMVKPHIKDRTRPAETKKLMAIATSPDQNQVVRAHHTPTY